MNSKQVSIIIPVYNAEKTIENSIKSVLKQSYSNFELILVNDGSIDGSLQICMKYNDKRIKVFTQKNKGPAAARNYGLKKAKGEFICFLDSDDLISKDYLDKMVNAIFDVEMCVCGYNIVQSENIKSVANSQNEIIDAQECQILALDSNGVNGYLWNKFFLKSIIYRNDIMFDEDIYVGEDLLFVQKYLLYCSKVRLLKEQLYNYYIREGSVSHNISKNTVTLLISLSRLAHICDSNIFKKKIVNRFISQALTFYELFEDKKLIEDYISRFNEEMDLDNKQINSLLLNKYRYKYSLYSHNKMLYLCIMKFYRLIKS